LRTLAALTALTQGAAVDTAIDASLTSLWFTSAQYPVVSPSRLLRP
jgi:hypothetical protein